MMFDKYSHRRLEETSNWVSRTLSSWERCRWRPRCFGRCKNWVSFLVLYNYRCTFAICCKYSTVVAWDIIWCYEMRYLHSPTWVMPTGPPYAWLYSRVFSLQASMHAWSKRGSPTWGLWALRWFGIGSMFYPVMGQMLVDGLENSRILPFTIVK